MWSAMAAAAFHTKDRDRLICRVPCRRDIVCLILWLATIPAVFLWPSDLLGEESRKQVLIVASSESLLPANALIIEGFRNAIYGDAPDRFMLFVEYLDTERFTGPEHNARMRTYLQEKYAGVPIDLVAALGPTSLEFLADSHPSLFPDKPIVFVAVGEASLRRLTLPPKTTGVISRFDIATTADGALRLQPDAPSLVVVTGAGAFDKEWEAVARDKLKAFENRLSVQYLSGLPVDDFLREVGRLPRNSIILLLSIFEDGTGRKFIPREIGTQVIAAASAPVYAVYDTFLDRGIVGGYITTFDAMGAEAGRLAARILEGENADDVAPTTTDSVTSFMVDWRQLRRWGLREADLPPDTVVLFKEPSLWERHKEQVIAAAALVLLQFLLIVVLVLQVRRRRRVEQSLRESEERTSLAVDSAHLGLWRLDVATGQIWANDACREILRLAPHGGLTRESFINACHPDDRLEATAACTEAIVLGKPYEQEYRLVESDGGVRWVLDRARIFRDATGKVRRLTGVVMDITERKQAEKSLRESEERYRNVVETQAELICRYLPDTTLTFVNDAYCRYFRRSRDELVGASFIEFIPEPARGGILQEVASLVQRPRTETYEHEVLRPDGSIGWQQWVDHVIVDGHGRVVEIQAIGRDTTELRRMEREAQDHRKEVTHLTRVAMLGELSGALAHELNQPLTAILSNAQAAQRLLSRSPVNLKEIHAILGDIANDDKRAGEVINRLRALMKKDEATLQPLDMNGIATDVLELAHSELIERRIAVTTRLAPGLPDIQGDRVQLQQVLLNLIMNACDAMAANNGVERILEVSTEHDGNGSLQLTVADRGSGLSPDSIDAIFEPFVTTKAQGLGLGLSICRTIVGAHGGRIWAVNNPGRGATFLVSLPIRTGGDA